MSQLKSPLSIGKYAGVDVMVSSIVRWMSSILCKSSSCVGIYKCNSRMGVRGLLTIVNICRLGESSIWFGILVILSENTIVLWMPRGAKMSLVLHEPI
jgi:hypothetical protein